MTHFSAKLALPLAVLLALALAGVLYARSVPQRDECPSQDALLDGRAFVPTLELRTEGTRSTNIERGRLTGIWPAAGERPDLAVSIVRTFGLPNLLLQPAMALPGRNEADDVRREVLDTDSGPVPIHYAYEHRGRQVRITGYVMAHRGEAIADPVLARLAEAPSALLHGTGPITLFSTAAHSHMSHSEALRDALDQWLREAWVHYQKVCSQNSPGSSDRISDSRPR